MAKLSMKLKQQAEPKFSTRRYNRCKICGRPHAYLRDPVGVPIKFSPYLRRMVPGRRQ